MESLNDALLNKYVTYLKIEKSLSLNTVEAYLRDLQKLMDYVAFEKLDVLHVTYEDLEQFLAQLWDIGADARSVARIISGIRSFFGFLLMDEYIQEDPAELLESPKIGVRLPEVLSVDEIDHILETIDVSAREGQRNRAMLEVLYSCGLRVSELVSLRISDIYPDEEFIRVEGKGSKQRLVPISRKALHEIRNYMARKIFFF